MSAPVVKRLLRLTPQQVTEARNALLGQLYRKGVPGLLGPNSPARPLGVDALVDLTGLSKHVVRHAVHRGRSAPEPKPEPASPAP